MMKFNVIVAFHNNLKKTIMIKLHQPTSSMENIRLNTQTQSMSPGVFFNEKMKHNLHKDCLLVNKNCFKQIFKELYATIQLPLTRQEIRQIQFLLEYSMMTYMYLFKDNSFFTREFQNLTPQQMYCIQVALHEYETPVLAFHKNKPSPVFEALQHYLRFEHDLFFTIIRHIVSRSIAKVCYCQRDIYYMNLLNKMSDYKQHDIGITPVTTITALNIRREYEHFQYKKDTIYKYSSLWQNIHDDKLAYCHSYFSNLYYTKKKNEETLLILTNNKSLGNLHLIYDYKKMDIQKEYQAILAILTTHQEKTTDMTIYYDSRFNMHYLSNEYNNSFDPIPTTLSISVNNVIMGFNKLSSMCSQKIYSQSQHNDKYMSTSCLNTTSRPDLTGENCAENPNIVTSDDYEDKNIAFESFILEYLHWAAVYGKK